MQYCIGLACFTQPFSTNVNIYTYEFSFVKNIFVVDD